MLDGFLRSSAFLAGAVVSVGVVCSETLELERVMSVLLETRSANHLPPQDERRVGDDEGSQQASPVGQIQLTPSQWEAVAGRLSLNSRELAVCRLLFDCLTRQCIADQMGITNRSVRHHMEQIHKKLGVKNRVGVVLRIIHERDRV